MVVYFIGNTWHISRLTVFEYCCVHNKNVLVKITEIEMFAISVILSDMMSIKIFLQVISVPKFRTKT